MTKFKTHETKSNQPFANLQNQISNRVAQLNYGKASIILETEGDHHSDNSSGQFKSAKDDYSEGDYTD